MRVWSCTVSALAEYCAKLRHQSHSECLKAVDKIFQKPSIVSINGCNNFVLRIPQAWDAPVYEFCGAILTHQIFFFGSGGHYWLIIIQYNTFWTRPIILFGTMSHGHTTNILMTLLRWGPGLKLGLLRRFWKTKK